MRFGLARHEDSPTAALQVPINADTNYNIYQCSVMVIRLSVEVRHAISVTMDRWVHISDAIDVGDDTSVMFWSSTDVSCTSREYEPFLTTRMAILSNMPACVPRAISQRTAVESKGYGMQAREDSNITLDNPSSADTGSAFVARHMISCTAVLPFKQRLQWLHLWRV